MKMTLEDALVIYAVYGNIISNVHSTTGKMINEAGIVLCRRVAELRKEHMADEEQELKLKRIIQS